MSAEVKTKGAKVETIVSKSLHKQFRSRCKKLNVSMSQRLRDLMQNETKKK